MKTTTFNEKYEYMDDEPINADAYGQIYRIRDKKVKTEYILKKLRKNDPDNNITGTNEKTFVNELNFLINVKGTNIINIIDYYFNQNDKYYYLILEKIDGDLRYFYIIQKNSQITNV